MDCPTPYPYVIQWRPLIRHFTAASHLCDKNSPNWPTYEDVEEVLSIEGYDAAPFNRFVEETSGSFRNYFEGFITRPGMDCGGNTMCGIDRVRNVTIYRKLHNSVSEHSSMLL